jgi:predicted nuclease of predicted toxin-antitoxin system
LKFKIDENFEQNTRRSFARQASKQIRSPTRNFLVLAIQCSERCRKEDRVLMTLDLDFANVRAYPPKSHPGIVVFRSKSQDKPTLVALLKRLVPALLQFSPKHQLWIVEPDRIRYREE